MAEPSLRFPVSTLIYYRGWYVAAAREATCWEVVVTHTDWLILHGLIDISGSDGLEGISHPVLLSILKISDHF